jgi:hypothetical protein
MYIEVISNHASSPTVLLRESYREGNKVKKRTLANLSSLPMDKVEMIRQVLRGDVMALIPIPPQQPKPHQVSVVDCYENAAPTSRRNTHAAGGIMKQFDLENQAGVQALQESPATTTTSRKGGLSSALAATLRGVLHMDLEFKVR